MSDTPVIILDARTKNIINLFLYVYLQMIFSNIQKIPLVTGYNGNRFVDDLAFYFYIF